MGTPPPWLTIAVVMAGMGAQIFLAVDRWVHRQDFDGKRNAERIDAVQKDVVELSDRCDQLQANVERVNELLHTVLVKLAVLEKVDELRGPAQHWLSGHPPNEPNKP
jgi:predicted nuclease with TOPRIM domain